MKLLYMKGSSNLLVDKSKPISSFKIKNFADIINLELQKGIACVKDDFNISNKSLFISFILHPKTSAE